MKSLDSPIPQALQQPDDHLPFLPLILNPALLLCARLHFTFKLHLRGSPLYGKVIGPIKGKPPSDRGVQQRCLCAVSPVVSLGGTAVCAALCFSQHSLRELIKNKWNQLSRYKKKSSGLRWCQALPSASLRKPDSLPSAAVKGEKKGIKLPD